MTRGILDNEEIEIPCQGCGTKIKIRIGEIKEKQNVTCPNCGKVTEIDARKFISDMEEINKALRNLGKKR